MPGSRRGTRAVALVAALVALGLPCGAYAYAGTWPPPREGTIRPDTLVGGPGADYLRGHESPDRLRGGGGADLLTGDTGSDSAWGGAGDDTLTGAAGGDRLHGDAGDDILVGGFGSDVLDGGSGDDTLDGANDSDWVRGGAGDDVIHGGSGPDLIEGGSGDDVLYGDSGGDVLAGGPGDDVLYVRSGSASTISCGPGLDTLFLIQDPEAPDFAQSGARKVPGCERTFVAEAVVDPNRGITYLAPDAGGIKEGTAKDDLLLGGPGADTLRGGVGNDVLWGLRQDDVVTTAPDVLEAGAGDDTVYGGPGPQRIDGGTGDDFINGGLGANTIRAGAGDDIVRLRGDGLAFVDAGPGNDTIHADGAAAARVACGKGTDVVYANRNDVIAQDCERVIGTPGSPPARLRDSGPPSGPNEPGTLAVEVAGLTTGAPTVIGMGSEDPAARFECALGSESTRVEDQPWLPCHSGQAVPTLPVLNGGPYLFVRAVNAAGLPDPSPSRLGVPHPLPSSYLVPAFGAERADLHVELEGPWLGGAPFSCALDGRPPSPCGQSQRMPLLRPGSHTLVVEQPQVGTRVLPVPIRTVPLAFSVAGPTVATLRALQFAAVVEMGPTLARRVPRVRFVLDAPARVTIVVIGARGRRLADFSTSATPGANAVKIPARVLGRLTAGRYGLRVAATGATGPASAAALQFAVIPRDR